MHSGAVTPMASDECSCGTGCTEPGGADDAEFARHVEAVHERRDRMRMADAHAALDDLDTPDPAPELAKAFAKPRRFVRKDPDD